MNVGGETWDLELATQLGVSWVFQIDNKQGVEDGTCGVLSEIRKGDLMVHRDFGIGCFCGIIEKQEKVGVFEGVEIEYKNNSRVFVSSEQLHLVQRYIGSGKKPALSMLGSKRWSGEIKKTKRERERKKNKK